MTTVLKLGGELLEDAAAVNAGGAGDRPHGCLGAGRRGAWRRPRDRRGAARQGRDASLCRRLAHHRSGSARHRRLGARGQDEHFVRRGDWRCRRTCSGSHGSGRTYRAVAARGTAQDGVGRNGRPGTRRRTGIDRRIAARRPHRHGLHPGDRQRWRGRRGRASQRQRRRAGRAYRRHPSGEAADYRRRHGRRARC